MARCSTATESQGSTAWHVSTVPPRFATTTTTRWATTDKQARRRLTTLKDTKGIKCSLSPQQARPHNILQLASNACLRTHAHTPRNAAQALEKTGQCSWSAVSTHTRQHHECGKSVSSIYSSRFVLSPRNSNKHQSRSPPGLLPVTVHSCGFAPLAGRLCMCVYVQQECTPSNPLVHCCHHHSHRQLQRDRDSNSHFQVAGSRDSQADAPAEQQQAAPQSISYA